MSYIYTLRYVFDPRINTPEKDRKLLDFVQKAKIDDVAFIINGEELNHSHLTKEETQVWLDAIIPLQKQLAKLDVTTSLNPWTTIMHSDRGFSVNPEIGFNTFVDINGNQAKDMACPADPTWRKYLADRYAQYASIHPRRLWMEDDFRHYNHTPLKLMCFCDYHMKLYQEKLGKTESRAEFVKNMLKPGEPTIERKIYLDQPSYNEVAPLIYGRKFEEYSRTTAAFLGPRAAELYPELENSMWTPQVKSNTFIAFQIITTALLGAKGIMLNIFDMMGNGVNEDWGYDKMLADIKPFASALASHRLNMQKLRGIKVLVDQDSAYTAHTTFGKEPEELLPHEKNWASLLASFGFATTILPVQNDLAIENQTIAIAGQLLRNLSNEQITNLITKNTVLLDGESIQVLLDRKLGNLLHIQSAKWHPCKSGYQSFEQADGTTVQGVKNPRITMLQHTGNYLQLDYQTDSNVKIWSSAYNSIDQKLGNFRAVIDDHIIVLPMDQDPKHGWESQFSSYKQGLMQQIMASVEPIDYLINMPHVKLNIQENGKIVWLANFNLDGYQEINWHLSKPLPSNTATLIRRRDNSVEKEAVKIEVTDNVASIKAPLSPLETIQLIF